MRACEKTDDTKRTSDATPARAGGIRNNTKRASDVPPARASGETDGTKQASDATPARAGRETDDTNDHHGQVRWVACAFNISLETGVFWAADAGGTSGKKQ
jgi:hypothetical protein